MFQNIALKPKPLFILALILLFSGLVFFWAKSQPSKVGKMVKLVRVDFEVFGKVQGVFFRKVNISCNENE